MFPLKNLISVVMSLRQSFTTYYFKIQIVKAQNIQIVKVFGIVNTIVFAINI